MDGVVKRERMEVKTVGRQWKASAMESQSGRKGESSSSPSSELELLCGLSPVPCPLWASVSSFVQDELSSGVSKDIPCVSSPVALPWT